ncbi:MAG: metallophosphoesterase [Oligoflexia bacterium]|nr:metallophosphoesterase [Oligoflexia bacterium]
MKSMFSLFNLIMSTAICWYIYRRLFMPIIQAIKCINTAPVFMTFSFLMAISIPSYFIATRYNCALLAQISSITAAVLLIIFFNLFAYEICALMLRHLQNFHYPLISRMAGQHIHHRQLIIFWSTIAIIYGAVGFWQGSAPPQVKEVALTIPQFPFKNFTIALISDLHLGATSKQAFLEDCVQKINLAHPDLVVIAGDLLDQDPSDEYSDLLNKFTPLKNLRSKYGTFMVLGNHEYYSYTEKTIGKILKPYNVRLLVNESVFLDGFNLVGLADPSGERFKSIEPSLEKAISGADGGYRKDAPSILIGHQPKLVKLLDRYLLTSQRFDPQFVLMLSGHTHGGQLFPFHIAAALAQPYVSGLHLHYSLPIYVTSGAGLWGPALRVFSSGEIALIKINY